MYNAMLVQMHDSRHQLPKYVNGFFNEGDAETRQSMCHGQRSLHNSSEHDQHSYLTVGQSAR